MKFIALVPSAALLCLLAASAAHLATRPRSAAVVASRVDSSLQGKLLFPPDNPWNRKVDRDPVDPNSAKLIESIGASGSLHPDFGTTWTGVPNGIPYIVVKGSTPRVPVRFEYADESDPGPYPIPPNAPIEGGPKSEGDRHVLVVDRDHGKLYELFDAHPEGKGWRAGSGAIFDLNSNRLRPDGWTSADAAGLPVLPGLTRWDEAVARKLVPHALRFTVKRSRRAYVTPARHFASHSKDEALPPMGMRVRLKSSYNISDFPPQSRVILQTLKSYGMIVADNGGDWFLSGAPDARWDDEDLNALKRVKGSDFEVVKMGPMTSG